MADYFELNILEASLNYVEFPVSDRKLGVGRRFVRTDYAYRDGQGGEELGLKAQTFSLTLPLFRGLDESYYPDTYIKLIAIIEDPDLRGNVEYIDPEFGPIQVQILDYDIIATGKDRDGVMLTLSLEEVGFDQSLLSHLTQPILAGASRASLLASQVDQEIAFIDIPEAEKPGFSLADAWNKFQSLIDAGANATDFIAAQLDEIYLLAERIINFSLVDEVERFSLFNAVIGFAGAAEDFANQASSNQSADGQSRSKQLIEVVLPAEMSAYDIGTYYFNDAGLADDIIFNNPTANPMLYPRGTTVRISSDAQTPTQRPGYGGNS